MAVPRVFSWNHQTVFHCSVCQVEITRQQWRTLQTCKDIKCRNVHRKNMQKRKAQQKAEWEAKLQLRKDNALKAAKLIAVNATDEQLIIIPTCDTAQRPPTRLPEHRRRRFQAHLWVQITLAAEPADAIVAENGAAETLTAEPHSIKSLACATCRGGCCEQGRDEAFISAHTIRRIKETNPGLCQQEIFDAYVERLPTHATEDSCVFHSPVGCSLPRAMRNDICNRHECHVLKKLDVDSIPHETTHFIVSMNDDYDVIRTAKFTNDEAGNVG